MKKYKKIIFDMDGTLVNSCGLTKMAFDIVCPKFDLPIPTEETIKKAIGYSNPEFYEIIYPDYNISLIHEFGEEIEKKELELSDSIGEKILFSNVKNFLEYLLSKNIEMFIASTGSVEHVNSCLEQGKIKHFFKEIHCNESDKVDMVKHIIKNEPQDFIMVGDKQKDSIAGKSNSVFTIGAGFGYCFKEDYNTFDKIIFDINELKNYI